eukprot:COSAG02_NODE_41815_length_390_cov_1.491409_1_plen_28_part_01
MGTRGLSTAGAEANAATGEAQPREAEDG